MGRTKAYCKFCRRRGEKYFLKGDKCNSPHCVLERRKAPAAQQGRRPAALTEYGRRLREKQKARRIYGLGERQFESYFNKASKRAGATGEELMRLLERRLDNVVFRLGFGVSRAEARQIVGHGHVKVNSRKVDIPSFQVKENDQIVLSNKLLAPIREKLTSYSPPAWLALEGDSFIGRIVRMPGPEDGERIIEKSLIVEYYSR